MIEVRWAMPPEAAREERIAAQCEIARQAAQRLYQQDLQHGRAPQPSGDIRAGQQAQQPQPILMSADNPSGHKLEELLMRIWSELQAKSAKLASAEYSIDAEGSHRMRVSSQVRENNERIAALLLQAHYIQGDTQAMLATLGPDQGPNGKPRL